MNKKYRKIICSLILSICMSGSYPDAYALVSQYNAENNSITVEGVCENSPYVNIRVIPYTTSTLSSTDVENGNVILKTISTDSNYRYWDVITHSVSFPYGKYITEAFAEEELSRVIMVCYDETVLDTLKLSYDSENVTTQFVSQMVDSLNLGRETFDVYSQYICSVLPSQAKTAQNLLDGYILCEGIARFVNSEITLSELIELYSEFTGVLTYEYDQLDTDEKLSLETLMREAAYNTGAAFSQVYSTRELAAKVRCSDTYSDAKTILLDAFAGAGKDMTDYNNLENTYKQNNVFISVYGNRNSLSTLEEFYSSFVSAVNAEKVTVPSEEEDTFVPSGGGGGGGGGGSVRYEVEENAISETKEVFSDIAAHWAKNEIMQLYEKGIVDGYEDGSFRPDNKVSRAQYTKMIMGLIGKTQAMGNAVFSDVSNESWYFPYISDAAQIGLVKGNNGLFNPEEPITREDAVVIMFRALEHLKLKMNGNTVFNDIDSASTYARDTIIKLAAEGIINGYNGNFNPKNMITRAEASAIINRAAEKIK